jgi:UPF0271 protein
MKSIDLNADCGESFGAWTLGWDSELLPLISSANVACGLHAGDPVVMERTVDLARRLGVSVGAHPGYPDLQGFGRRKLQMGPEEVYAFLIYQGGALLGFCRAAGIPMAHLKAHGALYNAAATDLGLAEVIARAVRALDPDLILLAQSGSAMVQAGRSLGLRVAEEAFADRAYDRHGNLVPRSEPGAVLHDPQEIARRALRLVQEGMVEAITGEQVSLEAQSICLHGDNPQALAIVLALRQALTEAGVAIRPLPELV